MKNINIRTKSGWTTAKNKQKYNCDRCGDKLWVAPDGKTIYCNGKWTGCEQLNNETLAQLTALL